MKLFKFLFFVIGCGLVLFLPVYFSNHPYQSGDFIPHLMGIIGSVMMTVGAGMYVIRKRMKKLRKLGKIKYWLDAHILFCLIGPLLVVYHGAFTMTAPNSMIAFYSMLVVVGSGVIGRYIFRHFQVSLSGERANLQEMLSEARNLDEKIKIAFADSGNLIEKITHFFAIREERNASSFVNLFWILISMDAQEGQLRRLIRHNLRQRKSKTAEETVNTLLMNRISLEKNIVILETATKLFSYWHKLHVPFIWLLLLTFIFHVISVFVF